MNASYTYRRLSKDGAAVLLIDHQSGLISLVQDFSPGEFKNNVLALAASAKYFKLPTILTTSFEDGPNGPLVPELKETFPDAPYIPRPGQINAWDNEDFVKAVQKSGRKQLIIDEVDGVVRAGLLDEPTGFEPRVGYFKIQLAQR
jgi:nicotinamidase-related amidase